MPLGLGLGLPNKWLGSSSLYNFFVDSVNGNDSNTGTSAAQAWLTISKLSTNLTTGKSAQLLAGSTWNEGLNKSTIDGLTIAGSAGVLPILDGSDVVTVWTAEGTTNVWKATVAHELTGTDRLRVYEDGVLMTRVANAVTCGSTAASFVDLQSVAGTPWTVKIHATADGNPNSNGKVYRVTVRGYGVIVNDNGAITSIRAQRVISNNGAIEAHANATIKKCLAVDGSKHNLLIGAGTLEDCIACRQDGTTSYEPSATLFVGFSNITTGLAHTVRRCGAVADLGSTIGAASAWIQHSNGASIYSSFTGEQLWCVKNSAGWNPSASTVTINGIFIDGCSSPMNCTSDAATINYLMMRQSASGLSNFQLAAITSGGPSTITIKNSVIYSADSTTELFRLNSQLQGVTLRLENCVLYCAGNRSFTIDRTGWTSGTLQVYNCIVWCTSFTNFWQIPNSISYAGDNNVYAIDVNTGDHLFCSYHGSSTSTLATWQAASGQDANSIVVGSTARAGLFSGTVANGDFRLAGSGAGASAAALSAGPQLTWDWNARAAVAGAPSAWPTVPSTLANAETYCESPSAWSW
jgi:hypothetical protein